MEDIALAILSVGLFFTCGYLVKEGKEPEHIEYIALWISFLAALKVLA